MACFRKIKVNNQEYEWHYSFDDYDYCMPSTLTIKNKKTKIIVVFPLKQSGEYCPFNQGVKAVKDGENITINLNRPFYITEIIEYIFNNYNVIKHNYYNGLEILTQLGYEFDLNSNLNS